MLFALVFDFTNGLHDTANAIATSVATRAVPPKVAVVAAAILNFVGAFVSLKVAATVAKAIVAPGAITLQVILAGILAATVWNLTTWRFGLPSSSSHALIGGVAGAAVASASWPVLIAGGLTNKVLIPSLLAPVMGLLAAATITLVVARVTRRFAQEQLNRVFKRLQLVSGSVAAFTHGINDAQKTMGIIALALLVGHPGRQFQVPMWVIFSSATAIALGSYIGGWRIVNTLSSRLVRIEPQQGFSAELSTTVILATTASLGFPVSTTYTVSGSIMGTGVASGLEKVRWKVTRDILIAWALTIPAVAMLGVLFVILTRATDGVGWATLLAATAGLSIVVTRHWTWESTAQVRARLNFLERVRRAR